MESPARRPESLDDLIYLDHNATTPLAPEVLEAMLPHLTCWTGNASSAHTAGVRAARAVAAAGERVASVLGVRAAEVVWTSGATEADNLAIVGATSASDPRRRRILVGASEHPAVLEPAQELRARGWSVELIPLRPSGETDITVLEQMISDEVALVSVMAANNETGVVNDVAAVAEVAHEAGALVHTDATQYLGRLPIDLQTLDVDLASFSAHKIYGPQGVGALYARRGIPLEPQMLGGGHQRGLRSGTLNVAGIVGFSTAVELVATELTPSAQRQFELRDRLERKLCSELVNVSVNGIGATRLPNTSNIHIAGVDAEAVIANMPNVAIATGSACSSSAPSPSHVLQAMGLSREAADQCLRFSLGRATTLEEIDRAVDAAIAAVRYVRSLLSEPELTA